MNGGLDLNTDRNLKWEQIAGGSAMRYERGAGIMTGPGYRMAAQPVPNVGYYGSLEAVKVRETLWVRVGTKIQYSHDGTVFYDSGVTLTDGYQQGFAEHPNGDILSSNNSPSDANLRFAVGKLKAIATVAGAVLNVGPVHVAKFVTPTTADFTADSGTEFLTSAGHGLSDGNKVLVKSTASLPGGLTQNTIYYVVNKTTDTFQLSLTSGGAPIDLTTNGTGTMTFTTGYVYALGNPVAYTGIDVVGTLTGVSVPVGDLPADTLVIQSSNPSTWVEERGHILIIVESKLLVMGRIDYEEIVYYSATADISTPEFLWDFDANGSFQKQLPMKITAAIQGVGGGYIFGRKGIHKINGFEASSGGLLTEEISKEYGAYNSRCVVDMDGVVAFQGGKRLMPITLTLTPEAVTAPFLGEKFDHPIRPWFESHDDPTQQEAAYMKWDSTQKILKIGAVVNGALETYVHDNQNPGFLPKENRSVATSVMFLGKSWFGHRDNGKWYEDDTGRTNDGIPIRHSVTTGRIECDKGRQWMKGKEFAYEGWITQAASHVLRVYTDGSTQPSFEEEVTWDFLVENDMVDMSKSRTVGLRGAGLSTPGGAGGETITLYHFEIPFTIRGINGDDFRFEWEIAGEGYFGIFNTWFFSAFVTRRGPRTRQ